MPEAYARICTWLVAILVFLIASFFAYDTERFLASTVFLLVTLTAFLAAPGRLGVLSWSAGIPVYYAFFFALLPLASRLIFEESAEFDEAAATALYVAAAGIASFALGTTAMRLFSGPPRNYSMGGVLRLNETISSRGLLALILIGGTAMLWSYAFGYFGLIATSGADAAEGAGIVSTIGLVLNVAHVIAWSTYFREKRLLRLALLSTVIMAAFGVMSSSKGQLVAPFALIALCAWGASGKPPYRLAVASVFLYVFVAFPFVTASRAVLTANEYTGAKLDLFSLGTDYLLSGKWMDEPVDVNAMQSVAGRLMPYFTDVVRQAGHSVDFYEGRTIAEGFEALVPRFINPEKQDNLTGNWTAKEFGYIAQFDDITTVAPTYMGEFYMNFGLAGVMLGMLCVGVLAVLVDRYVIVRRDAWTMPIAMLYMTWQEGFLGYTILPFFKGAVVWLPIVLAVAYFSRREHQ